MRCQLLGCLSRELRHIRRITAEVKLRDAIGVAIARLDNAMAERRNNIVWARCYEIQTEAELVGRFRIAYHVTWKLL
jgi:hypothetical protein